MIIRVPLCALVLILSGCSTKPKEEAKQRPEPTAAAARDEANEHSKRMALRPSALPEPPVPAVDPNRIAVEEDFVEEASQRITQRSNLELELQRLAKEIGADPR